MIIICNDVITLPVKGAPNIMIVRGHRPQALAKAIEKPRGPELSLNIRRSLYLAVLKPAAGLTAALSGTQGNDYLEFDFEDIERLIPIGAPDADRSFRDLLSIAVEEARKLEANPTPTTCED